MVFASSVPSRVPQRGRAAERPLHRHLLVEQHADEQRERIGDEQLVGFGITGDGKNRSCHGGQPTDARSAARCPGSRSGRL